jgi:hypothetical protein
MAEAIIGAIASGMTIAGLFKICVEAFDLIQTGRHQELDLKKLTLRLNIEKCRLYTWGQAMGLTESTSENQQRPLDLCQFSHLVKETLEVIFQLFNDSHKIKDTYGCRPSTEHDSSQLHLAEASEAGPVRNLTTSFGNFKIGGNKRKRSTIVQKARWVVHDRKKFSKLITEVKDLIDGLQDVTKSLVTVADQSNLMRGGIRKIRSIETLSLVAEVCETDHPYLSGVASMQADTVSMATTSRRGIETWTDSIDVSNDIDMSSTDLESLTVTELKHRLWQLMQERNLAVAQPGDPLALDTRFDGASIYVVQDSDLSATAPLGALLAPLSQWAGADESMRNWLMAKAEEDRRKQEEEKTKQEALRLDRLRIAQANLEFFRKSIDPTNPDGWKLLAGYMSKAVFGPAGARTF